MINIKIDERNKLEVISEMIEDTIERIYSIKYYFGSIKTGIYNLIKWFPVIYRDRDWDHYYFYKILATKFEHMEEFFIHDAHSMKADKVAHKLMIAKNLAKRLSNSDYLSNALIDYHKIYGDDEVFTFEPIPNKSVSRLIWTWPKHQHDMFGRASKHSDYLEQQDKEMLFELIKKNIDIWWD